MFGRHEGGGVGEFGAGPVFVVAAHVFVELGVGLGLLHVEELVHVGVGVGEFHLPVDEFGVDLFPVVEAVGGVDHLGECGELAAVVDGGLFGDELFAVEVFF